MEFFALVRAAYLMMPPMRCCMRRFLVSRRSVRHITQVPVLLNLISKS
jgi:hypothetical protein